MKVTLIHWKKNFEDKVETRYERCLPDEYCMNGECVVKQGVIDSQCKICDENNDIRGFISLGETGGATIFSNLKLAIPGLLAALSAIVCFFTGIISVFKNKERSVLVFLSTILGFLVLLWCLAELLFPH